MSPGSPRRLIDAKSADELWQHPLGNEFLDCLCRAYAQRSNDAVRRLAAGCGVGTSYLPGGTPTLEEVWVAVLEAAAPQGKLPGVTRAVCADARIRAHHARMRALAEWDCEARIAAYLRGLLGLGGASSVGSLVSKYVDLSAMPTQPSADGGSPLDAFIRFADGGDLPQVEGVFHPAVSPDPVPGRGGGPVAETEAVPRVAKKLLTTTRTVLLGEPGSGKTWTLMRVLVSHAQAWLEADHDDRPTLPIPVFVPLREFSGRRTTPEGALAPERFEQFLARCFRELAPIHDILLRQDRVVLLLDAYNEMPRRVPDDDHNEERDLGRELLASIAKVKRFVLSCRKHDYRNELSHLRDLSQLELQDLDPPKIQAVIAARFGRADTELARSLWQAIGGSDALLSAWDKAVQSGHADDFWERGWRPPYKWEGAAIDFQRDERQAIQTLHDGARLMHLARNPFRLGWLTRIYAEERELPTNRAALFEALIGQLLAEEAGRLEQLNTPWPEGRDNEVRTAMETVALALQAAGRTALPRPALEDAIADAGAGGHETAALVLNAALGAKILTDLDGELAFDHQLFQEFFAARTLLPKLEHDEPPGELFTQGEGWWDPHAWRETLHILAENVAEGEAGRERVALWLAEVSPEVALDVATQSDGSPTAYQHLSSALREALATSARAKLDETHPYGRNAAYRVLGRLHADDREGVGVIAGADGTAVPDIAWCPVPGGPFVYQRGERHELPTFHIARYPITWRQFQAFVDDPDGYANGEWWQAGPAERPQAPNAAQWPITNHPRERVTWYEAMAFCAWLTQQLRGQDTLSPESVVRLPTELEWEKAARGESGIEYPWDQETADDKRYAPGSANVRETWRYEPVGEYNLGRTSAVGAYPACRSPYGTYDNAGNVWEWCLDPYKTQATAREPQPADSSLARVVRGGSWDGGRRGARASFRLRLVPVSRVNGVGFRVVLASPISW